MLDDIYKDIESYTTEVKTVRGRKGSVSNYTNSSALYGHSTSGTGFGGMRNFGMPVQQYAANKDTVFASIFPGAVKCASQPWSFGYVKDDPRESKKVVKKSMSLKESMPLSVKNDLGYKIIEPLVNHSIETLMDEPNDLMDGWALKYCTYFSISLTARSFWLINGNPEKKSGLEIYYLPTHWVRPVMADDGNYMYRIQPQTAGGFVVPARQIVQFLLPNPSSPIEGYSNLQSQARSVNIEDKILEAQYEAFQNGIHPSVIIKAGRLPDMKGLINSQGPMPVLEPEQRQRLLTAVKLATAGPAKHREPFIVDGMIEDIIPYTHAAVDMDFQGGASLTKERIMSGFGTNRYVTGEVSNVNRSTAAIAEQSNNNLQVNPIIDLISRASNRVITPYFDGASTKMKMWIEPAMAEDPRLTLDRFIAVPAAALFTKGQLRKYVTTGKLEFTEADDDDEMLTDTFEDDGNQEDNNEQPPKNEQPDQSASGGKDEPSSNRAEDRAKERKGKRSVRRGDSKS